MKLGISLLFFKKTGKTCEGMKQSYLVDIAPLNERNIKRAADALVSTKEIEQGFEYVGIEDLFYVGGGLSEGNLLGRTSYLEYNTKTLGKKLVRSQQRLVSRNSVGQNVKYFNASLVYYYNDPEDRSDSFSVIIVTIVKASSYKSALSRIKEVAAGSKLQKQIVKDYFDDLTRENLHFLGINELAPIKGNIKKGDAYQTFYNDSIKSRRELTKMLLSKREIKKKIETLSEPGE
jgi:hypothetical protein